MVPIKKGWMHQVFHQFGILYILFILANATYEQSNYLFSYWSQKYRFHYWEFIAGKLRQTKEIYISSHLLDVESCDLSQAYKEIIVLLS